jgi:hypothetical protein
MDGKGMTETQYTFEDEVILRHSIKDEFTSAEELVETCLKEDWRSRNDDQWLQIKAWEKQGLIVVVDFKRLKEIFSNETIRRCRQKIQNTEGRWLPTDPKVIIQRRIKQDELRRYYGTGSWTFQETARMRYEVK